MTVRVHIGASVKDHRDNGIDCRFDAEVDSRMPRLDGVGVVKIMSFDFSTFDKEISFFPPHQRVSACFIPHSLSH